MVDGSVGGAMCRVSEASAFRDGGFIDLAGLTPLDATVLTGDGATSARTFSPDDVSASARLCAMRLEPGRAADGAGAGPSEWAMACLNACMVSAVVIDAPPACAAAAAELMRTWRFPLFPMLAPVTDDGSER